jgi:uncharacterized protein
MPAADLVRLFLFAAAVGTVGVLAGAALLRMFRERRGGAPPPGRRTRWTRRTVLALAALGLLCVAYGHFVEPVWLEVRHVRITSPRLPKGARPVRIAHVSDLHCDPSPRLEERLPEAVAAEKPDVIVFTGDAINSLEGLPVFQRCMKRLAGIAPVFAVTGNWDLRFNPEVDRFADTGVRELKDEAVRVDVEKTAVWVAGISIRHGFQLDRTLASIPPGAFTLLLYHDPEEIEPVAARGTVDLMCAGHIHGGQVALPFYGALVTLSRTGKTYEAGLYRVGGTWLHVSRGVGMEGGYIPRVRFWARPEVTVIEAWTE